MNMSIQSRHIHTANYFRLGAWLAAGLLLAGCGGGTGGNGQDPDPLVSDYGMAFVMRPLAVDANTGNVIQPVITEMESYTAGGDLYYRDLASPSAPQHDVTGAVTGGLGDVKDVEVSFDGTRLLFALRLPDIDGLDPEDQPTWNIWEYDIRADNLHRVIASDITAEAGQDVAPHYLPDGRIIFSSTRQRTSKATLLDEGKPQFAALDESRNEHAMVLHVMDGDGSNIHQVSMNQSHDLVSTVLDTGEVVFSRWDHMGGRNTVSLYRMHPDGSELQPFYGINSHDSGTNGATVQFLQPRQLQDGRLLALLLPDSGTWRGGDLVKIDVDNYLDNHYATLANQGALFGPAQEPATASEVHTDGTISPGGRFRSAWPLNDGTDRMLVSWSACRVLVNNLPQPCTAANLAAPAPVEADPIYGIFLYDMDNGTQLPIVAPQEGFEFTDVVAAAPRKLPPVLYDKQRGVELESQAYDEGVGYLDIRSVYDVDGVDTAPGGIAATADPVQTPAANRPARFLRIVKAVGIPDRNTKMVPGTAYGRSTGQLMREIIGYVPVQPDGSVRVKVPADVPLAISVLDADGKRIGGRHRNWLQVRPGETVQCNGCHDPASGVAHANPRGPAEVWAGAQATGVEFPNTDPALSPDYRETMAQTLTRHIEDDPVWPYEDVRYPSVDVLYTDVWTDPNVQTPDASFSYRYADLTTPVPTTAACQTAWTPLCRIVIHYEQHIHPLWSVDRGTNTCTSCHNHVDAASAPMVPAGQLDLSDGVDPVVTEQFSAYRQLLFPHDELELGTSGLQPVTEPGPPDPVTGLPTLPVPVSVNPSMSTAGARASAAFFAPFAAGASHDGFLTPAELRLLAEWLDIGAQYYNDPFAVP
jgi:Hydrazine synthase alpha subunit middle domain